MGAVSFLHNSTLRSRGVYLHVCYLVCVEVKVGYKIMFGSLNSSVAVSDELGLHIALSVETVSISLSPFVKEKQRRIKSLTN